MTPDDRPHGPEDEVRMTRLERHTRWLLRCYPAGYRQARGEEIIGTLLETTPDGRTWPPARDVRALVICGLKVRAAQNRQRTVGANLRVAVLAGLAMYLSYWAAAYLSFVIQWSSGPGPIHVSSLAAWTAAAAGLLVGVTVVLAWTARRAAVLAGALVASAGVAAFALVIGGPAGMLGPRLLQVLSLAGLAALGPRAGRPPRRWLWLPVVAASFPLLAPFVGYGWVDYLGSVFSAGLPLLAIAALSVSWVAIDARLIVAVLTYFAVIALQIPVAVVIPDGFGVFSSLPFFGVVMAIAVPAVWLLQRQSARPAPS
jgi:hypothetical protein